MKIISKISVCLEVGPQATGAFVPDRPGCWVFGQTKESALEKVKVAIVEWFDWLNKYGEGHPDISGKIEVEIVEMLHVNYNPAEAGKPEPLFWSEVLPVKKNDIERTIRLMEYSRKDLLSIVSKVTQEYLDNKPLGKPRTIRNCLKHIAYVEPWYITRLNIKLQEDYPEDIFELLNYTRNIMIECLQNFSVRKMEGVYQPRKDKSPVCDLWTTKKVLRRLVDHERLHTKYIQKVLKIHYGMERM